MLCPCRRCCRRLRPVARYDKVRIAQTVLVHRGVRMSVPVIASEAGHTLVETVMADIRQRVETRSLAPGARVPSLRRLADALGVSKSTVVEAYDRLAAEGTIVARPGSGFYVTRRTRPFTLAPRPRPADRGLDPLWIMRQSLDQRGAALRPGCGWLPPAWLPDWTRLRALRPPAPAPPPDLSQSAP